MRVFQDSATPQTCFFCLSPFTTPPRNPESFKCPHCNCWNRHDEDGQILSDEPAMHDESLNVASFAKRASPSKNRLPTAFGRGPFCHTCETNQMLLINMLSNYLPPSEDPSYDQRVAEMPAYKKSLQMRYPPVCKNCKPAVDEELRKKEHMARTTALGGWLKQSRQVGTQRSVEMQNGKHDVLVWKTRGVLWTLTLLIFVALDLCGFLQYDKYDRRANLMLPPLILLSLLWTFWDPTWLPARNARLQGRSFRVSGHKSYIRCQAIAWLSRLVTSSLLALQCSRAWSQYIPLKYSYAWFATALAMELVLAIVSISMLRTQRGPTVRLLEPKALKTEGPAAVLPTDPEPVISSLSISNQYSTNSTHPVFGQPSLSLLSDGPAEDMMDWSPINGTPERVQDREGWMRPQRFFPPEQPTGLEDLLENAKIAEKEMEREKQQQQQQQQQASNKLWRYLGETEGLWELGLFTASAIVIALVAGLITYLF